MTNETNRSIQRKTVVSVDLVGYNIIAESAEEGLGVDVVKTLNEQIQQFINSGLEALKLPRHDHFITDTGDGGILIFDSSDDAFLFATHIIKQTEEHNRTRRRGISKRIFRIGAASGEIVIEPKVTGGFDIAGITIARAVRLEAKTPPGGLLVDRQAFEILESDNQKEFSSSLTVPGKRDEEFSAYLRSPYPNAENDAAFFSQGEAKQNPIYAASKAKIDRIQLLRDIHRLHPNTYAPMIFLLEIPIAQRPSNLLSLEEKRDQVVTWAETNEKLPELWQVIQELLRPQ
jgi:class 3 adenylate cyclase